MIHSLLKLFVITLCSHYLTTASPASDLGLVLERALDVYAPVSPELGQGPCRAQGLAYKQAVKDGQVWALNMFDSSSKLPSGVLTGNLIQFGNFDQCLEVQHFHPELGLIQGQHCQVHFGADNFFVSDRNRSANLRRYQLDHVETMRLLNQKKTAEALSMIGATLSVCVPAACSPRDLQLHLRTALRGWLGDAVNVSVPHHGCAARSTDTGSFWPTLYSIDMASVILVIFTVFIGTACHLLSSQQPRNGVLAAFSACSSIKSLTKASTSGNALPVLDGIRVISIFMIMMYHHSVLFILYAPKINFHHNMELVDDWYHIWIMYNGSNAVDSFILLGGTLTAYNYLAVKKRGLEFNTWIMYLRRYLRITPTMIGVLIVKGMMISSNFTSNNHVAPKSDIPTVDVCKNFWWINLLYITNNLPNSVECVGEIWYLSLDMQLVWISPLFLYLLWRWPRIGKNVIGLLVLLGIALNFAIIYVFKSSYNPSPEHKDPQEGFRLGELPHSHTYARFGPWFIGFILGHILHTTSTSKNPPRLHKTQVVLGWLLSIGLMLTSLLYLHKLYQPDNPHNSAMVALFLASHNATFALGLSISIVLCVWGYGGPINSFLSSPKFLVPSRLTFAVYLSNSTVFFCFYVFKKHPIYYDDATTIVELIGLVVVCFVYAFLVHIFLEAPSAVLGKSFIDWISKKSVRDISKSDSRCLLEKNRQWKKGLNFKVLDKKCFLV